MPTATATKPKPATKRTAKTPAKKPAAKKTAARKPAAKASGAPKDLIELTIDKLTPSPLNPRKTFDQAGIDDLAASLKIDGRVFQNLVARKWTGKGKATHEIIAGERRFRAVSQLVKAGDWPASRPVPVLVIEADDTKVIELAIVENVQRKDLTPLEEARSFAQLRDLGNTTDQIAEAVSMSLRHVQVRLQLVDTLTPAGQEAMEKCDISLAQARALMLEKDPELQDAVLNMGISYLSRGNELTPEDIRHHILSDCAPVSDAIFPLEQYDGEFVIDDGDEDVRYFKDEAQFVRLQEAAITELEAELKSKWSWVKIERGYYSSYLFESSDDDNKAEAGAVIVVEYDNSVKVREGLIKRSQSSSGATTSTVGGQKQPQPAFTKKHLSYAHDRKTEALQRAVMDSPRTAMVLTCVALMGGHWTVRFTPERINGGRPVYEKLAARLDSFRPQLKIGKPNGETSRHGHLYKQHQSLKDECALYEAVRALQDDDLQTLFTCLIADRVGTFDGWEPKLGDGPLACALARDLEIDITETWAIDADYLALCKKPPMREIFEAVSSSADDLELAVDRDNMTAKAMRNALSIRPVHVLPREMQFGSEKDLEKGKAIKFAPGEKAQAAK